MTFGVPDSVILHYLGLVWGGGGGMGGLGVEPPPHPSQ